MRLGLASCMCAVLVLCTVALCDAYGAEAEIEHGLIRAIQPEYVMDRHDPAADVGTYLVSGSILDGDLGKLVFGVLKNMDHLGLPAASAASHSPQPGSVALTVMTDRQAYDAGDVVEVHGVAQSGFGAISIMIISPEGSRVFLTQINAAGDGTYSAKVPTSGGSWEKEGTYTVRTTYSDHTVENTFLIRPSPQHDLPTVPVQDQNQSQNQMPGTLQDHSWILAVGISAVIAVAMLAIRANTRRSSATRASQKQDDDRLQENNAGPLNQKPRDSRPHDVRAPYARPQSARPQDMPDDPDSTLEELSRKVTQDYQPGQSGKIPKPSKSDGRMHANSRESTAPNTGNSTDLPTGEEILASRDPYRIFGLGRDSTLGQIKARYRDLAKHYDPTRGALQKTDAEKEKTNKIMTRINKAYDQLKSLHLRERAKPAKSRSGTSDRHREPPRQKKPAQPNTGDPSGLPTVEVILASRDPYKIFGLGRDSTPEQIKARYKSLLKKYDPSKGRLHKTDAERKERDDIMKKIIMAYGQLKGARGK